MDWTQTLTIIGANLILLVTIIGINISMYLHTDKKIDAIQQEMKDFHGRLERQDAEFKAGMLLIQEKMRK